MSSSVDDRDRDEVDDGWTANPGDISEVRQLESKKAERAKLKAAGGDGKSHGSNRRISQLRHDVEARDAGAGEPPRLAGYAAKFNTLSKPLARWDSAKRSILMRSTKLWRVVLIRDSR